MTGTITKVLVDTSIWSRHLRSPNSHLMALLKSGRVVMHPFVIAELSLYSWPDRMTVLAMLEDMPTATVAGLEEVRDLIEIRSLYDKGIGLVDAHLLSSIILSPIPTELWTADSNLAEAANTLGVLSTLPLPRVQ
ncbi:MAG: PIN domain-containing protein [Terracidiphilus sp.]